MLIFFLHGVRMIQAALHIRRRLRLRQRGVRAKIPAALADDVPVAIPAALVDAVPGEIPVALADDAPPHCRRCPGRDPPRSSWTTMEVS
ncbi:unnamed protein product [Linum trigynum]|uniref:Uncharacterized protein n=1 Tax=Linum trigynum TaxID=586398 RepID=A0AAV2C6R5_9ROSI